MIVPTWEGSTEPLASGLSRKHFSIVHSVDSTGSLSVRSYTPLRSELITSLLKKSSFAGCSKMPRCKAPKILRSEAYFGVRRNDEGPARRQGKRCRWAFFSNLLGNHFSRHGAKKILHPLCKLFCLNQIQAADLPTFVPADKS